MYKKEVFWVLMVLAIAGIMMAIGVIGESSCIYGSSARSFFVTIEAAGLLTVVLVTMVSALVALVFGLVVTVVSICNAVVCIGALKRLFKK